MPTPRRHQHQQTTLREVVGCCLFLSLFCFALLCFALLCFALLCFVLFCFVLFCFVLFCFVLFCFVLFCFVVCVVRAVLTIKPNWQLMSE